MIYADPPWLFEVYSRDTGLDRDASNYYPVMTLEQIKALDIASFAAPDCVLFLWATAPMLPEALEVMAAWRFEYRTNFVWAKDRAGTGYWGAQSTRASPRRRQGRRPGARSRRAVGEPDSGGRPRIPASPTRRGG